MTFREELADRLRDARLAAGMTQCQLAQQVGVTNRCVSLYETAKRTPPLETMSIISGVLDASLDDLVPHVTAITQVDPGQTTIYDMIGE